MAYGKRPKEELYDLKSDPHQIHNVANQEEYRSIREQLSSRLMEELVRTGDPRVIDNGRFFEEPPLAGPTGTSPTEENATPQQLRAGKREPASK